MAALPLARRLGLVSGLLTATVTLDQATKALARRTVSPWPVSHLGDVFRLQLAENSGAFLGMGAGLPERVRFWIFTAAVTVFLAFALTALLRPSATVNPWNTVAMSLIVAGGIGNLIDRAIKGTVTDFLNLGIGWLRTGIFNVADIAIMAGAAMLVWDAFAHRADRAAATSEASPGSPRGPADSTASRRGASPR